MYNHNSYIEIINGIIYNLYNNYFDNNIYELLSTTFNKCNNNKISKLYIKYYLLCRI